MSGIKIVSKKNIVCVIASLMIYDNRKKNPMKVFRGLCCVLYSIIHNYVSIDYIFCKYKEVRMIYYDKIFADMSYN